MVLRCENKGVLFRANAKHKISMLRHAQPGRFESCCTIQIFSRTLHGSHRRLVAKIVSCHSFEPHICTPYRAFETENRKGHRMNKYICYVSEKPRRINPI